MVLSYNFEKSSIFKTKCINVCSQLFLVYMFLHFKKNYPNKKKAKQNEIKKVFKIVMRGWYF